jgi:radical SAM superfamily enzyme YgiQ (UPF0313 family)
MNILLVYPEFPDTFWSFKHALPFIQKRASLPPLGLMTVAALLPDAWEKRLVDTNVQRLKAKDLEWADYVFISAMTVQRDSARRTVQRDSARRIISRCKEAGVPVVAGGPIFVSEHEQFEEVDYFVLNEAEITLPMFLDDLARGHPQRVYATAEFPDIRETPAPIWELAKLRRYATMAIQYSRGCPFNCDFCNVTALLGHKPRTKTAKQIMNELDGLYRAGWRGKVFFVDDNFIGNKRALKSELLPGLVEWQQTGKGFTFHTEASINLADDESLMHLMVEAGFDTVFVGVETPDDCSLAECSKTQNKGRDMVEDVKRIQRAGLQVQGGFIVGFDSDTPSIFQRQIDFIQKSGIVTAMVGLLQAIPGTRLYERLRREGRLQDQASGDNVDGTTNIDGYQRIMATIYSPKHYYERVRTFLREYKPPKIKAPLDFQHVMAFFRSVVRLGIIGRERFHFWKLLLWTLFHRPRLFENAVTFAIYGYHFRKVSETVLSQKPRLVRRRRRRR